MDSRKH